MVGKWKNATEGDNTTVQISDHGIISDSGYDSKAYAFYSLADSEKYAGDTTSKEEIEHTFEVIQEAVKSEGYQVKSAMKSIYKLIQIIAQITTVGKIYCLTRWSRICLKLKSETIKDCKVL